MNNNNSIQQLTELKEAGRLWDAARLCLNTLMEKRVWKIEKELWEELRGILDELDIDRETENVLIRAERFRDYNSLAALFEKLERLEADERGRVILLNFAYTIDETSKDEISKIVKKRIVVIDVELEINTNLPIKPQLERLVNNIKIPRGRVMVNPPAVSLVAITLSEMLTQRLGYRPEYVLLKRDGTLWRLVEIL